MSDVPESAGHPPVGLPPACAAPPTPRTNKPFLRGCVFALSVALNLLAGFVLLVGFLLYKKSDLSVVPLTEQHYAGKKTANDKIAVITLDGVIVEGLMPFVHKQIEQAAGDKYVKAVVLHINSPGGSITASDDLHRRLSELRDGNAKKDRDAKPLLVSMGGLAASGGYYVAMPGRMVFAEPTTLTGSIGVYSSFPNIKKLADTYGVSMKTIKQGQIKASGSPFADMTAHEQQVWQDMVDSAYQRFLQVVAQGRPGLSEGKLLQPVRITPVQAGPVFLRKDDKPEPYDRYLADGGVWTADKALQHKLIDKIGSLDDAVDAASAAANLGDNYEAIKYERPGTLVHLLGLDVQTPVPPSGTLLDPARLEAAFMPRLWYLAPGAEASGFLAAARER